MKKKITRWLMVCLRIQSDVDVLDVDDDDDAFLE